MFKDLLLCALAGGLLVLASPGVDIWPAAFIAFAVIFWILDRAKIKPWKAMGLTGFVFYLFTTLWIRVPVTVFGGAPLVVGVMIALAVAVISALLFWAPLGIVAKRTNNSVLLFALVLVALELAKGKYFMGGMPWLNIGLTQYNNILSLQLAAFIGEQGLSFLVVMGGGCLYRLIATREKRFRQQWITGTVLILMVLFGFGTLAKVFDKNPVPEPYIVRLVQTGIDQEDKWVYAKQMEVYNTLLTGLRDAAAKEGHYDLMLLPESTFNVNPFTAEEIWSELTAISGEHAVMFSYDRSLMNASGEQALYNSMSLMTDGSITSTYDKMKLAPFGEYFPFEKQLEPIKKFFFGDLSLFTPGQTPVVFAYKDLRIAPLICFEASFSEIIRQRVAMGANVLAVGSNESWFGESLGRHQRLAMDILRAAEYRKYLLRATQDGISTVIDPKGRMVVVFPEKRYYTADIAFAPVNGQTLFARFSYVWYLVALLAYALLLINKRRRQDLT